MATTIKSELSTKNKYYVEKHRYYELKHFCLQYPEWKRMYNILDGFHGRHSDLTSFIKTNTISNQTETIAIQRLEMDKKIKLIEDTAHATDPYIAEHIVKAVTNGYSYQFLKLNDNIPCCRDTYYDRYRKFFWLLDMARN